MPNDCYAKWPLYQTVLCQMILCLMVSCQVARSHHKGNPPYQTHSSWNRMKSWKNFNSCSIQNPLNGSRTLNIIKLRFKFRFSIWISVETLQSKLYNTFLQWYCRKNAYQNHYYSIRMQIRTHLDTWTSNWISVESSLDIPKKL